jgi:GT2 family glycosyltransferase
MSSRPVSACVVNYNGERYLEATLTAVRRSRTRFAEILLVDNGSTDRSLELLRECFPEVRVVPLGRNGGPAAARNAGFRAAAHDVVLFIDNDVAPHPDCAARLAAALAQRSDALIAMPRVLYVGRPEVIQYDGADCHFLGLMVMRHAELTVADTPAITEETGSVVTACFLIDRRRWRGGEPFDESFLFNYEDHDFGVRCRIAGHALLSVPGATCLHGRGTEGLSFRPGGDRLPLRVYCLIRNRWRILLQSYAGRTLLLLAPCLLFYELFQLAGAARKGWLGIWLRAAGWVLAHPGVTLRRRRQIQQTRRVGDRALLTGGPLPFAPGLAASQMERAGRALLDRLAVGYWRLVGPRL